MSEPSLSDLHHYELACDQAIAMCNGDLRSAIKALIMANEYLEAELQDWLAAASNDDETLLETPTRRDAA